MTNFFKEPELYAAEMTKAANGNPVNAYNLFRYAEKQFRMPQQYKDAVRKILFGELFPIEQMAVKATDCEKYRGYIIAKWDTAYLIRDMGAGEGSPNLADQNAYFDRASARVRIDILADDFIEALLDGKGE